MSVLCLKRGAVRSLINLGCIAAALTACGEGAGPSPTANKGVIRFSLPPGAKGKEALRDWAPVLADLSARTGLTAAPYVAVSDASQTEALRSRKADVGWFSNSSGLQAVRRANGEVFARVLRAEDDDGATSVMIASAKSRLTLERALKCDRTLTIGLGDPLSIAGTLAPMAYLFAPRRLDPKVCFRRVQIASSSINLSSVANRRLDLATNDSALLAARPDAVNVRVLWRSPPLPGDPLIWRKDLDPAVKEKLRQFFLTYGEGESPAAQRQRGDLAKLGFLGFQAADNNHLLPIREMEAAEAWALAKEGGDRVRIAAAQKAFDNIRAQRDALEARTRAPAAAQ